jgi:cytochrome c-type biogenesis protein CcmH
MKCARTRRIKHWYLAVILLLSLCNPALSFAGLESLNFTDSQQELRYKKIIAELRCLVCQNQNLADSNADLAKDLRKKTHAMILDGRSDAQIIDFMVARYGDFIRYRPPFRPSTVLLWISPALLLAIGLGVVWRVTRRSRETLSSADEIGRVHVRELLSKEREP